MLSYTVFSIVRIIAIRFYFAFYNKIPIFLWNVSSNSSSKLYVYNSINKKKTYRMFTKTLSCAFKNSKTASLRAAKLFYLPATHRVPAGTAKTRTQVPPGATRGTSLFGYS